jgi:thiosulfate dehydrogenase (quinone) large subunit
MTHAAPTSLLPRWRLAGFAILRIFFGVVWAIDASFKWQPAFVNGFTGYLSGALKGQPPAVQTWIEFWLNVVNVNPILFARLTAVCETLLAVALILGVFMNLACSGGAVLSFMIWSTAEGFGGPYVPGRTNIGPSIIYIFVFAALLLGSAGRCFSLDRYLAPWLGRWAFLASGQLSPPESAASG